MFSRQLITELQKWEANERRKPLVLRGARQVGKTTAINMYAKSFDQYLYFNLDKTEEKSLFEADLPFEELLITLFLYSKKKRSNKRTLVFIDEIQNSTKAVSLLRYFFEEAPDLYVVAAGSLLESLIDTHISFPVGRVDYIAVRPCSFMDFLTACEEEQAISILQQEIIPDYAHDHLLKLFNRYSIIGGMPEVVDNYARHGDITRLNTIYNSLIVSYLDDVEKYAQSTQSAQYIRHIINTSFPSAGSRVTFEKFGNSVYRSREMKEAFTILEKTMLLKLIYPVTQVVIPLYPDYKKKPRLHLLDTGLVNYLAGTQLEIISSQHIDEVFRGKIAEHITGQELMAGNFNVLSQVSFWVREKKGSDAEVDYILPFQGLLIPIEVKCGHSGKLRSLHQYMELAPHSYAVRICSNVKSVTQEKTATGKRFTLINLPYYLIHRIEQELSQVVK